MKCTEKFRAQSSFFSRKIEMEKDNRACIKVDFHLVHFSNARWWKEVIPFHSNEMTSFHDRAFKKRMWKSTLNQQIKWKWPGPELIFIFRMKHISPLHCFFTQGKQTRKCVVSLAQAFLNMAAWFFLQNETNARNKVLETMVCINSERTKWSIEMNLRISLVAVVTILCFKSIFCGAGKNSLCRCENYAYDNKPFVAIWNSPTIG